MRNMKNRESIIMIAMLLVTTVGSLSVFIIGTVAKFVMEDLKLSYSLMGFAISIQRIASTITALFIGYAIDRLGPLNVLFMTMTISVSSLFLTPLSQGLELLLATRVVAGAVFPAYWPSCTKITSFAISRRRIGFATALFESGSVVGVVITYLLIPVTNSWRELFVISTLISLILAFAAIALLSKEVKTSYKGLRHGIGMGFGVNAKSREIVERAIIIFFAFLLALQPWAFYTSWLSTYIMEKTRTEIKDIWIPITVFLLIGMVLGIVSSISSDKIGGLKGRKMVLSITLGVTAISLYMLTLSTSNIFVWFFVATSIVSYRAFLPLAWAIINDIIPQNLAGFISSVNALAGQISMMITPIIMAYIRDVIGSFDISVAILALFVFISIPLYLCLKPVSSTNRNCILQIGI